MTDKNQAVERGEEQLEQLDEEIAAARQHLKEQTHEGEEERFIETGSRDKGETDDAIVPPG